MLAATYPCKTGYLKEKGPAMRARDHRYGWLKLFCGCVRLVYSIHSIPETLMQFYSIKRK